MGQLSELHGRLLELKLAARAAFVEAGKAEERRSPPGALESKALADATENLWRVLGALYGKANFNPNQPRVPRGNPDGGQWTDGGGSGGEGRLQTGRSATRRRPPRRRGGRPNRPPKYPDSPYSLTPDGKIRVTIQPRPKNWRGTGEPPPPGDNTGFPNPIIDELPDVPRERPTKAKERHAIVKAAARVGLSLIRSASPLGQLMNLFEVGNWLYEEFAPYIEAYWDEPSTIQELQRNVSSPAKGYDIHHVNERTASLKAGYPKQLVDGPQNLVRISRLMHWRITAYYMTPNPNLNWLTPRQHVAKLKTWEERTEFGLDVLREFGVLK